jgi:hypothetical protein
MAHLVVLSIVVLTAKDLKVAYKTVTGTGESGTSPTVETILEVMLLSNVLKIFRHVQYVILAIQMKKGP